MSCVLVVIRKYVNLLILQHGRHRLLGLLALAHRAALHVFVEQYVARRLDELALRERTPERVERWL